MMFVLVLGATFTFSSCGDDDDDDSYETFTKASIENTLWRANTTLADPLISSSFADLEIQETRIFFGSENDALVCIKYKNVNSVTGYESGEMINYANYEVVNNTVNIVTYKDNGAKEGSYSFSMKDGALVSGKMVVNKVRSFNTDDEKYFEDKMLYYGPDEVRFNFEITESVTKYNNDWFKYDPSMPYNLYVNITIGVDKSQKLWERGITEIVAYIRYSGNDGEQKVSLAVNPDKDVVFYDRVLLSKKAKGDIGRVIIRYEVWDHKKNKYTSISNVSAYDF